MKYCSKCGLEHDDAVAVCTNCGFSLQDPDKKEKKGPKLKTSCLPLNLVNFLYSITQITAVLFIILALAFPYIRTVVIFGNYFAYYNPNFAFSLVSLILNSVAFLISLMCFLATAVFVIIKKAGNDYVFTALTQGALSFTLLGAAISMFVVSCG